MTNPLCDLKTVESRQADVEQRHIGSVVDRRLQRTRPVVSQPDRMATHFKQQAQTLGRIDVVIDHQHPAACCCFVWRQGGVGGR